jgi:ATP-dependent Lon protease
MEIIKKELGSNADYGSEIVKLKQKLEEKDLPLEIREKAFDELNKLKFMSPMVAESTVIKNYLDWIIDIPWKESTEEINTLIEAEKILNEDHYGINDIKERILEFLAVRKLTSKSKGSILCFAGPPGVGKTSLARSIARATGKKYVKIALGGLKDEAEIRGHRKTYIGAMPGRIIQSLKKAKVNNPVFLLDEIDKIGTGVQGDPASALLEVLDPEQNTSFQDNYMGLDYDLSQVFFITTANNLQMIPAVLRDRLEIINLYGYTDEEKLEIAKRYLVKRAKEDNGLTSYKIKIEDSALKKIIRNYTKESGVRNLEREISKIFRKIAKKVLMEDLDKETMIKINNKNLSGYLGNVKFSYEKKETKSLIGVASGLAWTSVGGEILKIEVMVVPGKGKIQITGKLGDVMVESAKAALTYVRSQAENYNLPTDFYENNDIHIHVPEGAIPKDGPSAGITISTAILSAFIKKPVDSLVAMTGEITLRGFVSPIGGLKEKLLAAYRAGIKKVIIPSENEKDLEDIPDIVKNSLEIILAKQVQDVWDVAILK